MSPHGGGEVFDADGTQDVIDKCIDILVGDTGKIRAALLIARLLSPIGNLLDTR